MKLFRTEYLVDRGDVAKAFGKKIEDLTRDDLLSLIPQNSYDRKWETENKTDFILIIERDRYYSKTFLNRLNALWVYPVGLFLMPFKWLATGEWGFSRNTRFGRWLCDLIGEK